MKRQILFIGSLLVTIGILIVHLDVIYAHCDTLQGPVINDARLALQRGDVAPVLKWVKKGSEPEIRAAFKTALAERKTNRESADMKFFETLVRVHRAGEGAPFTGLKPVTEIEPIVKAADEAVEIGSVDGLKKEINSLIAEGIQKRFNRVMETIKHKEESVELGREYVEAYVEYVHYVENLHNMAIGESVYHEHEAE